jgi:hypothetical protein
MKKREMTDVVRLIMVCVSLCVSTPCFAGDSKSAMVVTVQSEATTFKVGEDIVLYATAKNLSDGSINVLASPHFSSDFLVKMIVPGGKSDADHVLPRGANYSVALKPGDEFKEPIFLSKKFNMTELGEYIIVAGPIGSDASGDFKVPAWSDPITLTIVK